MSQFVTQDIDPVGVDRIDDDRDVRVVDVILDIEIFDFRRNLRGKIAGIEMRNATNAAPVGYYDGRRSIATAASHCGTSHRARPPRYCEFAGSRYLLSRYLAPAFFRTEIEMTGSRRGGARETSRGNSMNACSTVADEGKILNGVCRLGNDRLEDTRF